MPYLHTHCPSFHSSQIYLSIHQLLFHRLLDELKDFEPVHPYLLLSIGCILFIMQCFQSLPPSSRQGHLRRRRYARNKTSPSQAHFEPPTGIRFAKIKTSNPRPSSFRSFQLPLHACTRRQFLKIASPANVFLAKDKNKLRLNPFIVNSSNEHRG